ncbi:hypothetical protein DSM106972_038890 [Dulcicalothrix desertica PCC 7102]|uniref:Uncharacterized protein n=1 Tax=Dulcicalothrix desertica PCC 7102 TaxID=232991 RepID=A0A3S1AND5_9CYAN|nr:hypothetical protein [Dulcicalothrix desertica]RUT05068.1 hypothetical protein DSM106972_038890 [Dulcicalothrix desertica PCC 7102]TWH62611.1 hypothetical protein CAL7102_00104 [Dulcicalothrix desertica PCC 7102]
MHSEAVGKPDVPKREVAIIKFLRENPEGSTASNIHQEVSKRLGDTISRPAYYKLLDRLVATGKIEQSEAGGTRRYFLLPQLHATNRLTLDDVYEMLPFVESSETMARAIEAQRYFFEHRETVIREAAQALLEEPAANLFFLWIQHLIQMLEADLKSYRHFEKSGTCVGQAVFVDNSLERRLQSQCDTLRDLLYRQLSIPRNIVDIPEWNGGLYGLKQEAKVNYNWDDFKRILERRVFGVGEKRTVLGLITVTSEALATAKQEHVISGSDGSFHAGTLGIRTAKGYVEDESFVVTFNNGVAYIRSSERINQQRGQKKFIHSAPITRQTLDDPAYKGMVLAPFMFPTLTDSEYEHMAKAATDVVQWRVDDEVFNGKARDVITGEQIVTPRIHIRDGTITPQERYFSHYYRMDPYGDIVREGIGRSRSILERIRSTPIENSRAKPQIYAGSVKSTQNRLFCRLLNWYIVLGSKLTRGQAIAPNWDISQGVYISDTDAMTSLFASMPLPPNPKQSSWASCAVLREFPSLTNFFDTKLSQGNGWFELLLAHRKKELEEYEKYRGNLPYHAIISEEELANDSYLYLLENADYVSFYIGHTSGNPAPKIPRYEFLCSLRQHTSLDGDSQPALNFVQSTVQQLVTGLFTCEFQLDRDHNYMSNLNIVKIIPSVVYQAHEFAKTLGKKLESDFKSIVVAKLAQRRNQTIDERDVDINPINVTRYLQRFNVARQALPPSSDENKTR